MALKTDGSLWACGYNGDGGLGLGDSGYFTSRYVPRRVEKNNKWSAISAGFCYTLALKTDGSLWAWGLNFDGRCGNNIILDGDTPIRVRVGTDSDWSAISAGKAHTIALKTDGSLWAWGYNSDGELGDGTNTCRYRPVRVGTDNDWSAISAGIEHTIALKTDGSLWAWGNNYYGQLGDGTNTDRNVPTLIVIGQ
jgi:alpha-tubulin suppressor-like RCC1 family protein